jgi:drug/metabolite transporter (DMT)-like permease
LGVALALIASAAWGVSDFTAGLNARRVHLVAVLVVSQPVGFAVLVPLALARGDHRLGAAGSLYAAAAGVVGTAGLLAFYRGLAIGTMGVVAPISATAPLVPVVVGVARGERPSTLQGLGVGLAIVGIVLASRERTEARARAPLAAGALLGGVAAACFGAALLALDAASARDAYWAPIGLRLASTALVFGAVAVLRPPLEVPRTILPLLALVGLLDAAGTILFAIASTHGLVSVISVLVSLYPVVIVALARVVLHERLAREQLAGAAAALAGAALISAG